VTFIILGTSYVALLLYFVSLITVITEFMVLLSFGNVNQKRTYNDDAKPSALL